MRSKIFLAFVISLCSLSQLKAQQLKGDPWIFQAYKEMYNRQPTAWELNIQNYNSGSWNNYGELKTYIQQYQGLVGNSIQVKNLNNGTYLALYMQNGRAIAADLISQDGGSLIAQGGGNIVTNANSNLTVQYGVTSNLKGMSFGNKYVTASAGTIVVPASGKGAIIIR